MGTGRSRQRHIAEDLEAKHSTGGTAVDNRCPRYPKSSEIVKNKKSLMIKESEIPCRMVEEGELHILWGKIQNFQKMKQYDSITELAREFVRVHDSLVNQYSR